MKACCCVEQPATQCLTMKNTLLPLTAAFVAMTAPS